MPDDIDRLCVALSEATRNPDADLAGLAIRNWIYAVVHPDSIEAARKRVRDDLLAARLLHDRAERDHTTP